MAFPKNFLDELKARLKVSDIVGRKVKLTRRGREFVGLSPFTAEKTPSFTVNDDKQFWHCFSSGEHGDVIKFLEKTEGLSFLEAVERLAGEAGLEMPQRDPRAAEQERRRDSLVDIMELSARWFEQQLASNRGREARAYLQKRGLSQRTIEKFRLGFAPADRFALLKFLEGENIPKEKMAEAGMIIAGSDIREPYDRFRNRVMFPIEDARGRIIAFGGRALEAGVPAKYLNSPETPLFHKGYTLYNQPRARKAAHESGVLFVVEGYMDVIGLAEAGIAHAVAPLGTALTEDQIQLLWRMVPEPVLCFDGDRAGLGAAMRAAERVLPLLKPGHSLRFALLPEGKDPDDLVRAEGPEAFQKVIAAARPLIDMLWQKEWDAGTWTTPEARAALEARIDALSGEIGDAKVRYHYQQDLRARLREAFRPQERAGQRPASRRADWNGNRAPGRGRPAAFQPPVSRELLSSALVRDKAQELVPRAEIILADLISHPDWLDAHCERLAELDLGVSELDSLRAAILEVAALHAPLDSDSLKNHLNDRGLSRTVKRLARHRRKASEDGTGGADAEAGWLDLVARHRKAVVLKGELEDAEKALADEMTEENLERLRAVLTELEKAERHGQEAAPT